MRKARTGFSTDRFHRPVLLAAIVLLSLVLAASQGILPAAAQPTATTITLSPSAGTLAGCGTLTVEIWLNDVAGFYGADVRLSFDPAVLQVVDSNAGTPGVQIAVGDFWSPGFTVYNTADNSAGTITYVATQLNPTPEVDGSGVILKVTFQAISSGSSALAFTFTKISDRSGVEIPATAVDGSLSTSAPAAPSLAISKLNSSDLRLSWNAIAEPGVQYRLYRDTDPYFTPAAAYHSTTTTSYDDLGALGNTSTNYYYLLRAECASGFQSANTNRVGEFDFAIQPGVSGALRWSLIAIPLEAGVTTADGVAAYIDSGGSIKRVARWNVASQTWIIRDVNSPFNPANFAVQPGDTLFVAADASAPGSFAWAGNVPAPGAISNSLVASTWNYLMIPLDQDPTSIDTADALAEAIQAGASASGMRIGRWDLASQTYIFRNYGSPFNPPDFPVRLGYPYIALTNSLTPSQWP